MSEALCIYSTIYIYIFFPMFAVDRRGESEESGDDDTRRKSINGEVDPNQPTATSNLMSTYILLRDTHIKKTWIL